MLDVPADAGAGLGVFEDLHQHQSGASFSKVLGHAAHAYYGTAGPAFVMTIIERRDVVFGFVKELQNEFAREHVSGDASGEVERAAARFALVGAAGELASHYGITGWAEGVALQAAEVCFIKAWLQARGGAGNLEEMEMLRQARRFIELHGEGRFTDVARSIEEDTHAPKTLQRLGFRRTDKEDKETATTEYLVFREAFRTELCAGFDWRVMQRVLTKHHYLLPESESPPVYTRQVRLPGLGKQRCYVIRLPED
ncbi:MAG: hypothetical protein ACREVK_08095 [Gammaproteobacteria bacterium]